jgi:branched-chain amino acid aminotransferase
MKTLINDDFVDDPVANISIYDLGLNRGYAVFDFFKIVNNKFLFLEDHLDRFLASIRLSNIPCPYDRDQIKHKIITLKEVNHVENGYVRITLTAGNSDDFINISSQSKLIIVMGHTSLTDDKPEGVNLISKYYQRSIPKIKTTDYFFAQMHRSEMLNANAADILYYTNSITETSRANIFFIKNNTLYTPKSNILEGVTRKKILSLYDNTLITDISLRQIHEFEEAFICSTTREIMPVLKIDDIPIGSGTAGLRVKSVQQKFDAVFLGHLS